MVQELRLKPLCPESPVQAQVLDQEAGYVLSAPVGHPPRVPELPHVCVNKGHPRPALSPGLKLFRILKGQHDK